MNNYRKYIESLANSDSPQIFFNSSKDHAEIVLSQIFLKAKKEVHIYAENLNGGIAARDYYLSSLRNFLDKGGKLKILIKDSVEFKKNTELINLLFYYSLLDENSIEIKKTDSSLMLNQKEINFTTADGQMFRLEEDTKEFTAFGYFKNEEETKILDDHFYTMFSNKKSELIHLN